MEHYNEKRITHLQYGFISSVVYVMHLTYGVELR